jgi:acyl-coenzyme A synthetase/AMP-(fatty) acid ligase
MPLNDCLSLWHCLSASGNLQDRALYGVDATVKLADLLHGSSLGGRTGELSGRSVVVAAADQLTAALALVELDGIASRLVLCPPDLPVGPLSSIAASAGAEAIVSDRPLDVPALQHFPCSAQLVPARYSQIRPLRTEWVLLTSGTTALPKLVLHTLATLTGAIAHQSSTVPQVWSTFYDIRRYGGLQIFLRAILAGSSLVLSSAEEPTADFLMRAGAYGVTHISGTPSHWRRALMSPAASRIAPQYVRLSGEIADQAILDRLQSFYPLAAIAHAFASTEAGVAFAVDDGLAGFPAGLIAKTPGGVELKVEDGSLRIRSPRTALRYLGPNPPTLQYPNGFVDTGDMLEPRDGRYYFVGRRDGTINVGGLKVHPEEVEAVINRHPQVQISLVRTKKSPITGALVVADVVPKTVHLSDQDSHGLQSEILMHCRRVLPSHKVPARIHFVQTLAVAESGKILRNYA